MNLKLRKLKELSYSSVNSSFDIKVKETLVSLTFSHDGTVRIHFKKMNPSDSTVKLKLTRMEFPTQTGGLQEEEMILLSKAFVKEN